MEAAALVYDSRVDTQEHIGQVRALMLDVIVDLLRRSHLHDASKLHSPEKEAFDEFGPKLREAKYGSEEYHRNREGLGPALEHHYKSNRHHPEFWGDAGISGMSLLDVIEMLCDWMAAVQRSPDGDIMASIALNQERFGYSDELKQIFINTVETLEASV